LLRAAAGAQARIRASQRVLQAVGRFSQIMRRLVCVIEERAQIRARYRMPGAFLAIVISYASSLYGAAAQRYRYAAAVYEVFMMQMLLENRLCAGAVAVRKCVLEEEAAGAGARALKVIVGSEGREAGVMRAFFFFAYARGSRGAARRSMPLFAAA